MASKRKFNFDDDDDHQEVLVSNKKHTLDSDEEDSDDYEKDHITGSDIEGEEDGAPIVQDEVKITPFNMREELQEGHFDKDGQYHWNKDAEIKDNWLDNIDWVKIKSDKNYLEENNESNFTKLPDNFNEARSYGEILKFMKSNETVQQTLQRLGKSRTKLSSAERLRRKKEGVKDEAAEQITKFTELANEILTKTGNMDIYEESYAFIKSKLSNYPSSSKNSSETFDMYSDDFEKKEKEKLSSENNMETNSKVKQLQWEFKWKLNDTELNGPYSTEQMIKWVENKHFKDGVYVRKVGESSNFYSSNRIDFDLYV